MCLSLHLLQEGKQKSLIRNKWFYFFLFSSQLLFACFKCYLLLALPILGGRDVECFLLIWVMLNSAFVFPPGARVLGHSFFQTLKLPSGKETPAPRVKWWVGLSPAFSKTALVPSYIYPDILNRGCVCMCMWSSHSTVGMMLACKGNWSGSGQAPKAVG